MLPQRNFLNLNALRSILVHSEPKPTTFSNKTLYLKNDQYYKSNSWTSICVAKVKFRSFLCCGTDEGD